MTEVAAIAIVMGIVQFLKKLAPTVIQGPIGVALVVVFSAGVTGYKYIAEGLPFNFGAITFLVAVIIGAMSAYSLIKVASGTPTTGTPTT